MDAAMTTTLTPARRAARVLTRETDRDGVTRLGVLVRDGGRLTGYYLRADAGDDMGRLVAVSPERGAAEYTVTVDHAGRAIGCTCDDHTYRYRRTDKVCEHRRLTEALVRRGEIAVG